MSLDLPPDLLIGSQLLTEIHVRVVSTEFAPEYWNRQPGPVRRTTASVRLLHRLAVVRLL